MFSRDAIRLALISGKTLQSNVIPVPVVQRFYSIPGVCLCHAPSQSIAQKNLDEKLLIEVDFWEVLLLGLCPAGGKMRLFSSLFKLHNEYLSALQPFLGRWTWLQP